ncbi:MAG: hypothetical protein AAGF87_04120 [Bacteroidota bacterium]
MPTKLLTICLAFVAVFSFTACLEEDCEAVVTYLGYEPVVIYPEEFRIDVQAQAQQELCTPAGFYYYQDYLLVIEKNEGLHIIDNQNPANPQFVSFLPVKGAAGLAVYNDVLYINNVTDLLTFDLSTPAQPNMLERVEDVFPAYSSLTGDYLQTDGGIVIDYIATDITQTVDCSRNQQPRDIWIDRGLVFVNNSAPVAQEFASAADQSAATPERGTGIGGSLARFTINNGTLYTVDNSELKTFDLSNPAVPDERGTIQLGWDIETIFPHEDLLFIGSRTGMHIYDGSDPLNPQQLSVFEHAQSCDPVFVRGDLAYVTLRSGDEEQWCNTITNRMEIVDVSDPSNPSLIEAYDLSFPAGLTVTEDLLFLCEGSAGFRVFDLQPNGLLGEQLAHRADIDALDVIGLHWLNQLITIDESGLSQLAYDTDGQLSDLSQIEVCAD